jgi:mannose/cellobiose epimerase-like protein (N-acyl-D-glucosamine 2-epimerase family)
MVVHQIETDFKLGCTHLQTAETVFKTGFQSMASSALISIANEARSWLFDSAFPLWHANNVDRDNWGFSECLDQYGQPTAHPRRINVQARQIYVFAEAKALGWRGDWESPIHHGLKALPKYQREDGLYCFKLNPDGGVNDARAEVYGQAFVLLALAHAGSALGEMDRFEAQALTLLTTLKRLRGHARLGFDEDRPQILPLRSNPHMHLFETCQAWMARSQTAVWHDLAKDIATLATESFIEPNTGLLCEHFDAQWHPIPDDRGLLSEPGHQFEWGWLLHHYGVVAKRHDLLKVAQNLHRLGLSGIDPVRGIPHMSMSVGQGPRPGNTRLWPVTEWLKSALARGDDAEAVKAWTALKRFFNTEVSGLWYDQMRPDGTIIDEPAPASTFYHIVCAISELIKTAKI